MDVYVCKSRNNYISANVINDYAAHFWQLIATSHLKCESLSQNKDSKMFNRHWAISVLTLST